MFAFRHFASGTGLVAAKVTVVYAPVGRFGSHGLHVESLAAFVIIALIAFGALGCGEKSAPVDATPFRQAIHEYLRSRNMALAIKEIKAGPTISGDTAQLSASLVHEELGGPSVTWSFHFERRQQDGKWTVVRHED